jgi:hypothetical protein
MKTGKVFWQLRLEFLMKEKIQIENTIESLGNEIIQKVSGLNDALTFREHSQTIAEISAKRIEIKQQEKYLLRCKARIIESEKNLKIVESPGRVSYL